MSDHTAPCNILSNAVPKIAVLENEVRTFAGLFERLDKTLSTLTEVSNSLQQMLAVHENRINQVEKDAKDLETTQEVRRTEVSVQLKEFRVEIKEEIDDLKKEIQSINKWRWAMYGAGIALGIVVSQMLPHVINFI